MSVSDLGSAGIINPTKPKQQIIVKGVTDLLKIWNAPVSVFGFNASAYLINKINGASPQQIEQTIQMIKQMASEL